MLAAVVTGAGGQDGSFLSEYLLEKNYKVIGIVRRRSSAIEFQNLKKSIQHKNFILVHGDITDSVFLSRIFHEYKIHEWYGLAARSHVGESFKQPLANFDVNAKAVVLQLETIRQLSPSTRFYNAATSEIMGGLNCPEDGYNENSPINPRSPYAIAKAAAYYTTKHYREAYGLHASSGILFNHSSTRRGYDFATRKITRGIAKIKSGREKTLKMGNLDAFRDESHALDMVRGMHLMLQQPSPSDYVLSSGESHSIKEMFRFVSELADINFEDVYERDDRFMRPSDVPFLLGNSKKAEKILGWKPKYSWKELLKEMYYHDYQELK